MSVSFYINGEKGGDDFNLSNTNASAMMQLMGWAPGPEGQLPVSAMPAIQAKIEALLDSGGYKKGVRPTIKSGNDIYFGIDADYVVQRLAQFQHLLIRAQKAGQYIYWG